MNWFNTHWVPFKTLVIKEIMRFARIWVQTILPPAITTTLYFLIFGKLIGPLLGEFDGFSYMQYIAPGLIMMTVLTNSYSNVVSSFYSSKFQGNIEELLVSPMPNYLIMAGFIAGGVCRGLAVGVVVTVVALFFTDIHIQHMFLTMIVVLLTATLFAMGGLLNAIFAQSFDDISIIPTFVLTPLTYTGGVFYSIDMLPDFWQGVSQLNPILYMVNAFRYGMLGISDINIYFAVSIILLFVVALFTLNLRLLNKGTGVRK